jgi:hypothetical protein
VAESGRFFILISTHQEEKAPSLGRARALLLLRLLRQRPLLRCGLRALGEARRERLEPRAQRRERLRVEGKARRVEQAAFARQAAVDLRDPAGGLELDRGGGLALEGDVWP